MARRGSWSLARRAGTFGALALICCGHAWGAGYEKAVVWSGRFAGMGGAAVAAVDGAESLYFNPAGLAGHDGSELSINLSPTFTRGEGVLPAPPGAQFSRQGNEKVSPVFGALASHALSSRFGVGLGFYVSGGLKSSYENVDYTSVLPTVTLRPTIEVDLAITEAALGAGYEIAPGLRVGAAWRVVRVAADFSSVRAVEQGGQVVGLQNVHFSGLEDTRWAGFRVGAQYQAPDKKWGLGVSWRNEVNIEAEGIASGEVGTVTGAVTAMPGGTATVRNAFPQQIALGGFCRPSRRLLLAAEYAWTQYSDNQVLDVSGNLGTTSLDASADIVQRWSDMSNVRVGAEYTGLGAWRARAGYVCTSQVTPAEHARATSSPPGAGHTFTLGGSRQLGAKLAASFALEYSIASGTGASTDEGIGTGRFEGRALALHTGAAYRF